MRSGSHEDGGGSGSRALTVAGGARPSWRGAGRFPVAADFLAHMVACETRAPQFRLRRRADPGEAAESYRSRPAPPRRTRLDALM